MALSFKEVEEILDNSLPPSVDNHRHCWGNNNSSGAHSHAQAWIEAGWKVDTAYMKEEWVRFVRT